MELSPAALTTFSVRPTCHPQVAAETGVRCLLLTALCSLVMVPWSDKGMWEAGRVKTALSRRNSNNDRNQPPTETVSSILGRTKVSLKQHPVIPESTRTIKDFGVCVQKMWEPTCRDPTGQRWNNLRIMKTVTVDYGKNHQEIQLVFQYLNIYY